jgi:hypothetical protein
MPGGVATHSRILGKLLAAARRVAAPGDPHRMNPTPSVFADATPIKEISATL